MKDSHIFWLILIILIIVVAFFVIRSRTHKDVAIIDKSVPAYKIVIDIGIDDQYKLFIFAVKPIFDLINLGIQTFISQDLINIGNCKTRLSKIDFVTCGISASFGGSWDIGGVIGGVTHAACLAECMVLNGYRWTCCWLPFGADCGSCPPSLCKKKCNKLINFTIGVKSVAGLQTMYLQSIIIKGAILTKADTLTIYLTFVFNIPTMLITTFLSFSGMLSIIPGLKSTYDNVAITCAGTITCNFELLFDLSQPNVRLMVMTMKALTITVRNMGLAFDGLKIIPPSMSVIISNVAALGIDALLIKYATSPLMDAINGVVQNVTGKCPCNIPFPSDKIIGGGSVPPGAYEPPLPGLGYLYNMGTSDGKGGYYKANIGFDRELNLNPPYDPSSASYYLYLQYIDYGTYLLGWMDPLTGDITYFLNDADNNLILDPDGPNRPGSAVTLTWLSNGTIVNIKNNKMLGLGSEKHVTWTGPIKSKLDPTNIWKFVVPSIDETPQA